MRRNRRNSHRGRASWLGFVVIAIVAGTNSPGTYQSETWDTQATLVERQVYLMGTRGTLATYARDREFGLARLESFVQILDETERELSTWRDDTPFSRINHQAIGAPIQLSPRLCLLFAEIEFWQRGTGGTFDPAVGALVEAYGLRNRGRRPSAAVLARARQRTGLRHFRLDRWACTIERDIDAILDEGAFGKGEGLDRVLATVSSEDSPAWMIDLGGQIMVRGRPPGAEAWQVAIAHPFRRNQAFLGISLRSGSLATSAGSERDRIVSGARIGHILDPRTGRPAGFHGSVTVWHERALVADILSTALYVMGVEKGLAWADAHAVAACFLVPCRNACTSADVDVRASQAFTQKFLSAPSTS